MSLSIKFQSQEIVRSERQKNYSEIFQGTELEIDQKISSLMVGSNYGGKGVLISFRKRPNDGGIWLLEATYSTDYDDNGVDSNPATNTGPTSQRLSSINIGRPLNQHPNYLMNWNHYLVSRGNQPLPTWWATAKKDLTSFSDTSIYRWIRSTNDLPAPQQGYYPWIVLADPTVGADIDDYDYETYQIIEIGKHTSKAAAAAWAVTKLNRIFSSPQLGDFGITAKVGGDWKLDSVEIWFDGKYWVAQRTYTLSGDELGWNKEIYEVAT